MTIMAGRAIAAVGVVLAFLGIWISAIGVEGFGVSYWDADGSVGAWMLALACLAAALLVAALASGNPAFDVALAAVGGVLWGTYLFFPATFAGDRFDWIDVGGWLGVCTVLVSLGALAAYLAARRDRLGEPIAPTRRALVAAAVAAVGLVIVVISLFLDVERGEAGGTYWNVPDSGHSLGYLFLIVAAATVLALASGLAGRQARALLVGACSACVVFGLTFFVVVGDAFNELDQLDVGAWLAFVGGALAAGGALVAWHQTIWPRVHPTTAAAL